MWWSATLTASRLLAAHRTTSPSPTAVVAAGATAGASWSATSGGLRHGEGALGAPPCHELREPLVETRARLEPELAARGGGVRQAARDAVDRARRAVLDLEVLAAHDPQERLREAAQAGLLAARDVEDPVSERRLHRQDVRVRDVGDEDEVHGLAAVTEDQRRLAVGDALHPSHEDLRVDAVDVHTRPVDVEVAQRDVVERLHRVEAA